jgi:hypothetical protein
MKLLSKIISFRGLYPVLDEDVLDDALADDYLN